MKKFLAVLVCLMLCAGSAFAEGKIEFFAVKETATPDFMFYRAQLYEDEQLVFLTALDSNGEIVADLQLPACSCFDMEYSDFYMDIFALKNGKYYVESMFLYEGITREHVLFSYGDDGFVVEHWLYNPGYSDAFGLFDKETGEELVYGDYSGEGDPESKMDETLNAIFGEDGVVFENASWLELDGEYLYSFSRNDILGFEVMPGMENAAQVRTTGNVNVRAGAGKQYAVLGVADEGSAMEYLFKYDTDDEDTVWYCVKFDGGEGWISSKFAYIDYQAGSTPTSDELATLGLIVMTGDVYVRSGPGLAYDQLGVVKTGHKLDYLGQISTDDRGVDWYRIVYDEYEEAWVSSRYSKIEY